MAPAALWSTRAEAVIEIGVRFKRFYQDQTRAAFDEGARPLLQLAVDSLKKRRADLHMRGLLERNLVWKVAQFRTPVRSLLHLLLQERVLLSQLVVLHARSLDMPPEFVRRQNPRAVT
jgi:hypothetical protein